MKDLDNYYSDDYLSRILDAVLEHILCRDIAEWIDSISEILKIISNNNTVSSKNVYTLAMLQQFFAKLQKAKNEMQEKTPNAHINIAT